MTTHEKWVEDCSNFCNGNRYNYNNWQSVCEKPFTKYEQLEYKYNKLQHSIKFARCLLYIENMNEYKKCKICGKYYINEWMPTHIIGCGKLW